ncbi:MAG: heat-inducible transcriptional repressor HrcA [Deltaproteobacteria bacterium]|nr:heat-inducible transcriptional repressor HrcA [Deltaproteobacteria bacterium]
MEERVKDILSAIITSYIHTAEPVGSRTLSKNLPQNVSPATIRNIMSDLGEMGYLEQPHTSSGRVPTSKAYRFYVDSIVTANTLPQEIKELIDHTLSGSHGDLETLLAHTTHLLAELTKFTGVVAAPRADRAKLKMMEFIRLNSRQVFVVLITKSNMVHNKIIETGEDISQEHLNSISKYLNQHFSGHSLMEVRSRVMETLVEEKARYDQLLAHVVRLSKKAFELPGTSDLYVEGQSNLVRDFPNMGHLEGLLKTLEEKISIVGILDKTLKASGVQLFIGMEHAKKELQECSVIASQYGMDNNLLGAIGVIGPTRMDYSRVIPIVDYTAKILSQSLSSQ